MLRFGYVQQMNVRWKYDLSVCITQIHSLMISRNYSNGLILSSIIQNILFITYPISIYQSKMIFFFKILNLWVNTRK
jgi:hypothetical protein